MEANRKTLEEWVETIKHQTLPAFTKSVQQISELAHEDEADLEKLSGMIKQDPALSTRVLRACSSVYRSRRGKINTVSRALVMLGVQEVKKICLTCSLVDGLLEGTPSDELLGELTGSLHAATQARLFALDRGDPYSEEVFLSALMMCIGPLALWRAAPDVAQRIRARLSLCKESPEEAEKDILGFTFGELSDKLAEAWKLTDYFPKLSSENSKERKRASEVYLSTRLARSLCLGNDHSVVRCTRDEVSYHLSIKPARLDLILEEASTDTLKQARSFGIPLNSNAIAGIGLLTVDEDLLRKVETEIIEDQGIDDRDIAPPGDPSALLQVYSELSSLLIRGEDPTISIVQVLEGMNRGIGLDRVVFALLNDSRDFLRTRLTRGYDTLGLQRTFRFRLAKGENCFFSHIFMKNKPFWFQNGPQDELNELDLMEFQETVGEGDFFLAPVVVDGKWIAAFYADRRNSGRSLDQEAFNSFNQLALQANLAFQHYKPGSQNEALSLVLSSKGSEPAST